MGHSISHSHADPAAFYVTSEAEGIVSRFSVSTGKLISSSPVLGTYATGVGIDVALFDLGPCLGSTAKAFEFQL